MPKVEKQVGDDPDPSEWLFVSLEQKRIDQSKPYDAKKACWVPDEAQGYVLGEIKSTKGDLVNVGLPGGEVISENQKRQQHSPFSPLVHRWADHFSRSGVTKFHFTQTQSFIFLSCT